MEREVKITIICPIEIDDVTNAEELYNAEVEAINNDLLNTEYLDRWRELSVDDMGECEDEEANYE